MELELELEWGVGGGVGGGEWEVGELDGSGSGGGNARLAVYVRARVRLHTVSQHTPAQTHTCIPRVFALEPPTNMHTHAHTCTYCSPPDRQQKGRDKVS